MSVAKKFLVLSVCLCVTQTVRGNGVNQGSLQTHNIHIFGKQLENGLQVRTINGETTITEDKPDKVVQIERQNLVADMFNSRINGLLDNETVGVNLKSMSKDLKEIFESAIAEKVITEVADRIKTIMTTNQCLENLKKVQNHIQIFLKNENAATIVNEKVNEFTQFVTDQKNVVKMEENGKFIFDLLNFLAPRQNTFNDLKEIIRSHLRSSSTKQKIESMFGNALMLAEIDPNKRMINQVVRHTTNRMWNKVRNSIPFKKSN